MIRKLYGVHHSGKPSIGLLEELAALPRGSHVGIEFPEECVRRDPFSQGMHYFLDETIGVDGKRLRLDKPTVEYWNAIVRLCHERGLIAVFVDAGVLIAEHARRMLTQKRLKRELEKFRMIEPNGTLFPDFFDQERNRRLQELHALSVQAEHLYVVGREEHIVARAARDTLDALLIGRAHTEIILAERPRFAAQGFIFEDYAAEEVEEYVLLLPLGEFAPSRRRPELLQNPPFTHSIVVARHTLLRQHRAVLEGRVTDGSPDFVGTWDTKIPARGLFELYIEQPGGHVVHGRIEDTFGTAHMINGHFGVDTIRFEKVYCSDTVPAEAQVPESPIFYQAERKNGSYEGKFTNPISRGRFWMKKLREN